MALSEFEITIGGLTSIPAVGGLIFLGYKSLGEGSLDTSKLKPKKRQRSQKKHPHLTRKTLKQKARRKRKILIRQALTKKNLLRENRQSQPRRKLQYLAKSSLKTSQKRCHKIKQLSQKSRGAQQSRTGKHVDDMSDQAKSSLHNMSRNSGYQ